MWGRLGMGLPAVGRLELNAGLGVLKGLGHGDGGEGKGQGEGENQGAQEVHGHYPLLGVAL